MKYVSLKINTTGLDPDTDKPTEIAIFLCDGPDILKQYHSLINPHTPLSEEVQTISGLSDELLSQAPSYEDIKQDIISFIGDYPILGHNIYFDLSFLKLDLPNQVIDTLRVAKAVIPDAPNYRLKTLCTFFSITEDTFTLASHQARLSNLLFEALLPRLIKKKKLLEESKNA